MRARCCCAVRDAIGARRAQRLAHGDVPAPALATMRVGRMVALQKPNGRGILALVVDDALCRLVGRTLAQAFAPHFQHACLPHQYGLSRRAGSYRLCRASSQQPAFDCSRNSGTVKRYSPTSTTPTSCPRPSGCASFMSRSGPTRTWRNLPESPPCSWTKTPRSGSGTGHCH